MSVPKRPQQSETNQFEGPVHDPFYGEMPNDIFGMGDQSAFVPQADASVFTLGNVGESFLGIGGQKKKQGDSGMSLF